MNPIIPLCLNANFNSIRNAVLYPIPPQLPVNPPPIVHESTIEIPDSASLNGKESLITQFTFLNSQFGLLLHKSLTIEVVIYGGKKHCNGHG